VDLSTKFHENQLTGPAVSAPGQVEENFGKSSTDKSGSLKPEASDQSNLLEAALNAISVPFP